MRQINAQVAKASEKALTTPEGKLLVDFLVGATGLTERTFIADAEGRVDPYRAAIRDGERAIVSLICKLQKGELQYEQNDN
jgi:S-adenosylmethionine synthetase